MVVKAKGIIFILAVAIAIPLTAGAAGEVAISWDKNPLKLEEGGSLTTPVHLDLADGFYLNAKSTDLEFVTLEGIQIKDVEYPKEMTIENPKGGGRIPVYPGGDIDVVMEAPPSLSDGIYRVSAILHYEGCSEEICLRAKDKYMEWTVHLGEVVPGDETGEGGIRDIRDLVSTAINIIRGKASETVLDIRLVWLVLIAFLGGIMSSFTPCILPLIPVTMLIIGVRPEAGWKKNFKLAFMLVVGMAVTYALVGTIAGLLGRGLSFLFQSRLFVILVVFVFFIMGLSLLGLYTFELPRKITNALSRVGGAGYKGAFLAGISMGVLATPCIGPVLGALLIYGASSGRLSTSFILFLAYSLGLGLVLIVAGAWYGTVMSRLKKVNVKWVKRIIGILFLATALYYLNSLIPFTQLFVGRSTEPIAWQPETTAFGYSGGDVKKEKPMMLLFSSKWCPPCIFIKNFTLKNAEIVRLSKGFENVEVDMTYATRTNQILADRYKVQGWPTIIFVSPDGKVFEDLTIFGGYMSADTLASYMREALKRSGGGT